MIFVKNLESVSNQEWSTTDKYPGVRWKFLIDADFTKSSGLSLGTAEIAPGGDLILHYHSPSEIYVIKNIYEQVATGPSAPYICWWCAT